MTETNQAVADPLAAARAKLEEIAAEKSLPEDAVTLFGRLIEAHEALRHSVAVISDEFTALAKRPAQQVSAAGVDLSPLVVARGRVAEARAAGAIPGVVAALFEDVFTALGAVAPAAGSPAPPTLDQTVDAVQQDAQGAPQSETDRPAPTGADRSEPAGAAGG